MPSKAHVYEALRQAIDATFRAERWLGVGAGQKVAVEAAETDLRIARETEDAAWLAYNALLQATPPTPPLTCAEQLAVRWVQARQRVLQAERELNKRAAARDAAEQDVIKIRLETTDLHNSLTLALLKL